MKEFYGEFANWTDVSSNFGAGDWNNRTVKTDEPSDVFAVYETGNYEGSALVLYRDAKGFHSVEGSHCSCYGLEDQWEPHDETPVTIRHQAGKSSWGLWHQHSAQILLWLDTVTAS